MPTPPVVPTSEADISIAVVAAREGGIPISIRRYAYTSSSTHKILSNYNPLNQASIKY